MDNLMNGFSDELMKIGFVDVGSAYQAVKKKTESDAQMDKMKKTVRGLFSNAKERDERRSGPGQAAHGLKDVAVGTGRTVAKGGEYAAKGVGAAGKGLLAATEGLGSGASKLLESDAGKMGAGALLLGLLGRKAARRI